MLLQVKCAPHVEVKRLVQCCSTRAHVALGKRQRGASKNTECTAATPNFVRLGYFKFSKAFVKNQYLRKPKKMVDAMTAASQTVTGPTKKANMYHIV